MKTRSSILLVLLLIINASCISKAGLQNNENITPPQETDDGLEQEPEGPQTTTSFGAYKHVFIIGVDGGGAFFKDTATPQCDKIFKEQATTYRSKTSFPTISAQCWGSILHGVLPEFHGLTNKIIETTSYPENSPYPSIFRVARESMPDVELASFVEWNPINIGIVENGFTITKVTGNDDNNVAERVIDYLSDNTPTLMFVQFSEPDEIGEKYGFGTDLHLASISSMDILIGKIYDKLKQEDLLEESLFIVTADHGGINKTHGGNSDAEIYVFLGIAGKTVTNGNIIDAESRDVAAIAAYALGLESPRTWTGHVPTGVFCDVIAGERNEIELPGSEYRKHQTEVTPELSKMTSLLSGHKLIAYLPFDGNINDAYGKIQTTCSGTIAYSDAYYGEGIELNNGYVTLKDVKFSTASFSVAFWLNASPLSSPIADPGLISNKDWQNGVNKGFILSYRGSNDIKFNVGDGKTNRIDYTRLLPTDYDEGWMHVILTVDRDRSKVRIYYDFTFEGNEAEISDAFAETAFDSMNLNIGQDGTGILQYTLPAQMDELIITADILSEADVAAFETHYKSE